MRKYNEPIRERNATDGGLEGKERKSKKKKTRKAIK